jgi:hypothetical protein
MHYCHASRIHCELQAEKGACGIAGCFASMAAAVFFNIILAT